MQAASIMMLMSDGAGHVWLPDPDRMWVEGNIVGTVSDEELRVCLAGGEEVVVRSSSVLPKNPACEEGTEDLAALSHLDEPNVLHNLHLRFNSSEIYTWTGKILMALNPWRAIDGLYSPERLAAYCRPESDPSAVAPHVFAVAAQAYRSMADMSDTARQVILVSGESGSGKTETTKYILQHLAAVSSSAGGVRKEHPKASTEQQVLNSNPMLEAFGNARTLRNDNSSRFGKFIMLEFGPDGMMGGASVQTYLLEKSRVVRVAAGERNYHIFHQLCYAASSTQCNGLPFLTIWSCGAENSGFLERLLKRLKTPGGSKNCKKPSCLLM